VAEGGVNNALLVMSDRFPVWDPHLRWQKRKQSGVYYVCPCGMRPCTPPHSQSPYIDGSISNKSGHAKITYCSSAFDVSDQLQMLMLLCGFYVPSEMLIGLFVVVFVTLTTLDSVCCKTTQPPKRILLFDVRPTIIAFVTE
jgi:hypothetical protein